MYVCIYTCISRNSVFSNFYIAPSIYIYTHSLKLGATLSLWSLVSEIAQDEKGIESDEEVPARFQMQFLWYTAVT